MPDEKTPEPQAESQQPSESKRGRENKNKREKSVRWQKIAIDQLGYTLNLVLTFTVATLGYGFVLLRDDKFIPGCEMCHASITVGFIALRHLGPCLRSH
jgi:hypothetical protein